MVDFFKIMEIPCFFVWFSHFGVLKDIAQWISGPEFLGEYSPTVLTNIKFKSFLCEGVTAASSTIMLLQNQDPFANFGQKNSQSKSSSPTANNNCIKILWHLACQKSLIHAKKNDSYERGYS